MKKTYLLGRNDPGLRALLGVAFLQLRGKRIIRARRSTGSVLLIDLGKLHSYSENGKARRRGEWRFLVWMSPWMISKGKRILLNSDKPPKTIDAKLPSLLVGREVQNVSIKPRGDFELDFDGNIKFSVRKHYDKKYNDNWTIFYKNDWSIANATEDDLYQVELNFDNA
jgi:hypothetical protein